MKDAPFLAAERPLGRRTFLRALGYATCGAAVHGSIGPLGGMVAWAQAGPNPNGVFVLVNLAGGASYNIAPPFNGVYIDRNKRVAHRPTDAGALPVSGDQGLHPSLTFLKSVYDAGRLGVINMVGYPDGNRSHDESTQIWFRGARAGGAGVTGGWGAKLTCHTQGAFAGVSLGGTNLLIQGDCNPPRAFGDLANFGEDNFWGGADGTNWLRITRNETVGLSGPIPNEAYGTVRGSIDRVQASVDVIKRETTQPLPVAFPNNMTGFQRACRDATRLIAARTLGVRFIYLELGGFDTHSDEKPRLTQLMSDLNTGMKGMVDNLKALGRWNDVTVVTMSEFGRTMENDSGGTDHGHATPMFVLGGRVAGGVKSPAPTAAESTGRHFFDFYHVDFRSVFWNVVRQLGVDPALVYPEPPTTPELNLFV